jgi:predicted glycoside hydrolase/deacetylase ChbG (UPF0249 family)
MNASPEPLRRPLVLCADDFGLTMATSRVIAALAASGRLSATSCMTSMPDWRASAPLLEPLAGRIDIGLHLTLTNETPLMTMPRFAPGGRLPPINALITMARRGGLPLGEIAHEIDAQFAAFAHETGRAPDFVDGHQHFHALPGLRDIVLSATARHAPRAWLRSCEERIPAMLRRPFAAHALRSAWLCRGLAAAAAARGIATNAGFSGFYTFAPDADFERLFAGFVTATGPRHLLMVHPGAPDAARDTIAAARVNEANFLGGSAFPALLGEYGLRLARGRDLPADIATGQSVALSVN